MLKEIKKNLFAIISVDWDRRLFDSLIPLPDGTSYNAYLIKGSEKTVLIDSTDPAMLDRLMTPLQEISKIDYVISLHTEQDHSGAIPHVLEKYPEAVLICSPKAKELIMDHLLIPAEKIRTVEDGEELSLGDKTLEFIHFPWVHWPETMFAYLKEDKVLYTCDFYGSHLATTDLFATDECVLYDAAKRYFAEIMMPFRPTINRNLPKLDKYDIEIIAPSHGPLHNNPKFIRDAYNDWLSDNVKNEVIIPYVSMHGSVEQMVRHLMKELESKGITVYPFNMDVADMGKLAIRLVDAATIVVGTPTVLFEPHPTVGYAVRLANILKPKTKFVSVLGSYGWGSKVIEQVAGMIPNLKVEIIDPLLVKGAPKADDFKAIEKIAEAIYQKHKELGIA